MSQKLKDKFGKAPIVCNHDRVMSGWENVVKKTIEQLKIQVCDVTVLDIGCADGRKSAHKYVEKYHLLPRNVSGIEIQDKHIKNWKVLSQDSRIYKIDVVKESIDDLCLPTYHVVLLCEILEHIEKPEDQYKLVKEAIRRVTPGGGIHITFPRNAVLENPHKRPYGHKCKEVDRVEIYKMLTQHFEFVEWAAGLSWSKLPLGPYPNPGDWHDGNYTVNFFGRVRNNARWNSLSDKHSYSE